ncbi:MAG: NAD(P)(+) transhydrogenase (Re/Si-specific) subunit beta [Alphaproteobacteria bacterium]|nr:NAD(P)(+) transhydrogenase (Re/Si-specific) subunit beta [Alphaproteobacteria bacterium]
MTTNYSAFLYLISAVCFIFSLRGLSSPKTAIKGNWSGIIGMIIAVAATLCLPAVSAFGFIVVAIVLGGIVGLIIARRIAMTALPQLVAAFHSLVGLAAVFVAWASFLSPAAYGIGTPGHIALSSLIEMSLGVAIGAITFSGSVIAFSKLQGLLPGKPFRFKGQTLLNALLAVVIIALLVLFAKTESTFAFLLLTLLSFALGFLLILPVGGADMPVVISMLNSYSGWAAAGIGFTLRNSLLVITGALVGSSGAILSYIMCKAMNRSIINVLLGGGGKAGAAGAADDTAKTANIGSAEDAAVLLENAQKVIIVPGYGMAVAQSQFALEEMAAILKKKGAIVKYAIHPVAGRMPGHMNVLLAEAKIPYEDVFEMDDINGEFSDADVVYIIGANDVTNPLAKTDSSSPIYGMPVLDVEKARNIIVVKRSLKGTGYAGIDNPVFYAPNTMMLLGDAKKVTEEINKFLK